MTARLIEDRPKIPRKLRRQVELEAGHRCAIPTCRDTVGLQIDHIRDYSKVKEHEFHNLILLCVRCHTRKTNGEIDQTSMRIYKANLGLLTGRYSDFERRCLDSFAQDGSQTEIRLHAGFRPLLHYLIRDGIFSEPEADRSQGGVYGDVNMIAGVEIYRLTKNGTEFVNSYANARSLGEEDSDDEDTVREV